MTTLGIDLETFSTQDIKKVGAFRYIEDPSFEILLFAFSVDGDPAVSIDLTAGELIPKEIEEMLWTPDVIKTGWNNAFERGCLHKHCGLYLPPESWEDTMILAANCGLPLKLERCCEAMQIPQDKAKMRVGDTLIREFCSPQKRKLKKWGGADRITPDMDPENWELFKQYNCRDVDVEGLIRKQLIRWKPDEVEHRFWCLDARINEKGVRADLDLVHHAEDMDGRYKAELTEQAIAVSGIENPNSTEQIKAWLTEQEGIEVPSLNKKVVADVVAQLSGDQTKAFMEIRSKLAKTSTKKYDAFIRCACRDDHIRGCFQFFGTHTGRFAGRLVQLQNLPGTSMEDLDCARQMVKAGDYETMKALYDSVTDPLSQLLRTVLIPEPGHQFVVADFSAIEARVAAWVTGEEWRLDVFRNGGDIYCSSASQMFHVPVEKHGANSHLRKKGKVAELALGYGGGVNALLAFGADKLGMTNEDMAQTVDLWRAASPKIVEIWSSLERAMKRCIVHHAATRDRVGGIVFQWERGIVWMVLPSGRRMAYYGAEYGPSRYNRDRMVIKYVGINQRTKQVDMIETWGGKIFENLVQAIARDCLRDTMMRLDAGGWDIRGHVHDEIICTEPLDGRTEKEMCDMFAIPITWAPGLPLSGAGFTTPYYIKD